MKQFVCFFVMCGLFASAAFGQNIATPVFVLKDGDATAAGYSGTDKSLYVDGGAQQSVGWITFQTQGIDVSKIASAKLVLFVNVLTSPGTLDARLLTADITAPENNVQLTTIPVALTITASQALGTANVEKAVQLDLTAAVKSGTFKGVALTSDDGLAASFDSKEGHLAPVILLTNNVNDIAAVWLSGTSTPAAGIGKDGDYYLNTTTGDVSARASGTWTVVTNIVGPMGAQGSIGLTGAKGDQGIQGDKGLTGDIGAQGAKGDKGDQGIQGDKGLTGDVGAQGAKGDKGDQGIQGIQGLTGDTGATGATGPQGSSEQKSLITQDDFSYTAPLKNYWTSYTTGGTGLSLSNSAATIATNFTSFIGKLYSNKQKSVNEGKLIFTAVLSTYEDNNTAYGPLSRGLVNGTDRNNAIEFINITGNTIQARTVSGGVATTTNYAVGASVYNFYSYTIIATKTKVEFYFNGNLIATHITNIPTLPLNMYFDVSSWAGNVIHIIDDAKFEIISY
jgi:Collagen triple helix repeat (20 copies).